MAALAIQINPSSFRCGQYTLQSDSQSKFVLHDINPAYSILQPFMPLPNTGLCFSLLCKLSRASPKLLFQTNSRKACEYRYFDDFKTIPIFILYLLICIEKYAIITIIHIKCWEVEICLDRAITKQ